VGAARHGFDNAVDQLKVVNPGVEFCVDGIHCLKYVRNGKIVSQDDDENVGNSQAYIVTPRFSNNVINTINQSIQRKTECHTTFQI